MSQVEGVVGRGGRIPSIQLLGAHDHQLRFE